MADDVDPRFAPEFQRGYDPATHRSPRPTPRVEERREATRLEAPAEEPVPHAEDAEIIPPPRRNPFLIALPIIAAVLLAACVLLIVRWTSAYSDQFGPTNRNEDADWLAVGMVAAPGLLVGGLLAVTLWLTILSFTPRPADA